MAVGHSLLGRGILRRLRDLRDEGYLESLLLYVGAGEGVVLHSFKMVGDDGSVHVDLFRIGLDGVLILSRFGELGEGEDRETVLRFEGDFEAVDYAAVESLHGALMREDFWDALAYRLGREGKPGYGGSSRVDPEVDYKDRRRICGCV